MKYLKLTLGTIALISLSGCGLIVHTASCVATLTVIC